MVHPEASFYIPVELKGSAKTKPIIITGITKVYHLAQQMHARFVYNGKLIVKTDGKIISTNANIKPYWDLIGSYK